MADKNIKNELQGLIMLISFFKQIRHKGTLEKLGFYFVNDLFNILSYRQCILWQYVGGKVTLIAASGQVDIEKNSPLAQFVQSTIKQKLLHDSFVLDADKRAAFIEEHSYAYISDFTREDKEAFSSHEVSEFLAPHMTHVLLCDEKDIIGGVWMARDKALSDIERAILEDAGDALAEKLNMFRQKRSMFLLKRGSSRKVGFLFLIAFFVFCLWPVRFSITSTAEIVAKDSSVVTIPFSGLIQDVYVEPNAKVEEGDLLFSLDKTRLRNEVALSTQALETARERLLKTEREFFLDPKKNSEINFLKEDLKLKSLELAYARDRLSVSDVKAKADGIVLFSDKNDVLGRPAEAGQKIMTFADPEDMELLVRIPADSMLALQQDVPIRFFLNVAPLVSHKAQLYNVSYQPSLDADGLLTYKARAVIENIDDIEKIGLTGTAKLYGGRTIMIFNILRRPLIALRNFVSF